MPDERHNSWLKDVLGIDTEKYVAALSAGAQTVRTAMVRGADAAEDGVIAGAKAVAGLASKGLNAIEDGVLATETAPYEAAMKSLDAEIKHVADAGLDTRHYAAQEKSIRDAYADAIKIADKPTRAIALGKVVLRANQAAADAKADVARVSKSAVEGVSAAVTHLRDGAKALIDKLPQANKQKPELAKRLSELDASIAAVGKVDDRAARAKQLKQISATADLLMDAAVRAAGAQDSDAVQAVYSSALKDRYGFEITNPSGMKNTHLDKVYQMFEKVPETDVVQGKLKTLTYQPVDEKGKKNRGAAYGGAVIEMGDYGDEKWPYKDPKTGADAPVNGFSISTLHELGHSVDDRFKIMDENQGKPGGGGWRKETLEKVADAFIGQFKAGAGKKLKIDDKQLGDLVRGALGGAGVKKPDKMSNEDWAVLQPTLEICAKRRNDKWPWGSPHEIGGRAYHEAYENDWVSYDMAVRKKALTVRDYQWRAPGEWFAELYAYSYFNSKPPPPGVDGAITAYMYGGKAAAAAAPSAKK